ncbi:hypothetical protein RS81_01181 [Microbacterium terrae]|uniref:Uncharacterized protein n=1 Tax=Microbacterium terrae TaxID=69369 RepID=A0A0M2HD10_9MICO|nr:hypothetical protein RS81_01181 [Microbacterium terrae]
MQPHPLAALAPVSHQFDAQLGAHQVERAEAGDEVVGGATCAEGHLVGDLEGRLERDLAVEVGRRGARPDGSRVAPPGEVVQPDAAIAEALPHPVGVHRRELAERLHPEPREQSDEVCGGGACRRGSERSSVEHCDRQRCEEARGTASGNGEDRLRPGGGGGGRLLGGEGAVCDADPHIVDPDLAKHSAQHRRRLLFAAVVPRRASGTQRAQAGTHRLHARRPLLDAGEHRGEGPLITGDVGGHDVQPRAPRLSVTATLSDPHPLSPRRGRARRHEILLDHGDRDHGLRSALVCERGDRPVGKPQHQAALHRGRLHQTAAFTASGSRSGRSRPASGTAASAGNDSTRATPPTASGSITRARRARGHRLLDDDSDTSRPAR